MTTTARAWTAILIVVVIAIIGWILYILSSSPSQAPMNVNQQASVPEAPASPAMNVPSNSLSTASNDDSDTALTADFSSVDDQIKGMNGDSKAIDRSMGSTTAQ